MNLWAELKKPQGKEVGPYAYLTNQLGHYVLGAGLFQILGIYYLIAVVLYFLLWETRHWRFPDSLVDTFFVLLGCAPAWAALPIALVATWITQKQHGQKSGA